MTKFTKKAVLFILGAAVIVGCKKDDKNSSTTKTQLITSGNWKVTSDYYDPAVDWDGDGHTENEVFGLYSACDKDDVLTFKTDGSFTLDEGASKCDPSDPQVIESSTWKFSNNESVILAGPSGSEQTIQLLELSSTTLKIKMIFTVQGVNYAETTTYSH